jgi:hypothetical protein
VYAADGAQTDPKLRRDYLIIGACWLKLIRELERQDWHFIAPAKAKETPLRLYDDNLQ